MQEAAFQVFALSSNFDDNANGMGFSFESFKYQHISLC